MNEKNVSSWKQITSYRTGYISISRDSLLACNSGVNEPHTTQTQ